MVNKSKVNKIKQFQHLERFCEQLLLSIFQEMNLFTGHGKEYTIDKLKKEIPIIEKYNALFNELLQILSRAGYIRLEGKSVIATVSQEERISRKVIEREKEKVLVENPVIAPYIRLVWACATHYPELLSGKIPYQNVLFPDGSKSLVEDVYKGNEIADYFNMTIAQIIKSFIGEKQKTDAGTPVSILEAGAGTGSTSRFVFKAIKDYKDTLYYYYTDISSSFLNYGRNEFGQEYPFVQYKMLNIEKDITSQGIKPGSMDIVVAGNVLHATKDINNTLCMIKRAIKKNGLLLINEVTSLKNASTMTFGLTDGWWLFTDSGFRISGSPLLSIKQWESVLAVNGYKNIAKLSYPGVPVELSDQHIIACESDGLNMVIDSPGYEVPAVSRMKENSGGQSDVKGTGNDRELFKLVCHYIKGAFSRVLNIEPDLIGITKTFEVYGVDSLSGTEIVKIFKQDFGDLDSSLMFEYITIEALAGYFIKNHRETVIRLFNIQEEQKPGYEKTDYKSDTIAGFPQNKNTGLNEGNTGAGELSESRGDSTIAIIGLSGRYPASDTLDIFWDNLREGKNCIRLVPEERWPWEDYADSGISKWGGFLNDIDKFDSLFFHISPREAEGMDPQERLFLETVWALLEDAGYSPGHFRKRENIVGVFVGVMNCAYEWLGASAFTNGIFTGAHSSYWSIANRISYLFDFKGPSMAVDTACSSSLAAIHLACQSIIHGECDYAVAGGVNLILHPVHFLRYKNMNMLSQNGECRSFGSGADGFVDGEGVGAVFLKPFGKAVEDGDQIYGIIKGSAINQDGKTGGYSVPNPNAHAKLVCDVLSKSGIEPDTITYIEAQGTATDIGDTIEIKGLSNAFKMFTQKKQFCSIGSVKSNIGHLESAGGIAGLTKVLLQMKHKKLVPSLHSSQINSNLNFDNTPFYIQQTLRDWDVDQFPRRAGISSFGAGGTNVHMIVEEYTGCRTLYTSNAPYLFVLSARTEESLKKYIQLMLDYLSAINSRPDYDDSIAGSLAYTLQVGREAMNYRLAVIYRDLNELITLLKQLDKGEEADSRCFIGNVKETISQISQFIDDEEGDFYIESVIKAGKIDRIARFWVSGFTINWELLYSGQKPLKISLPTYPFRKVSHWVKDIGLDNGEPESGYRMELDKNDGETGKANEQDEAEAVKMSPPVFKQEIKDRILRDILKMAGSVLMLDPDLIDPHEQMTEYGFDSIALSSLANLAGNKYSIELSPSSFFQLSYPSITGFIQFLLDQYREELEKYYNLDLSPSHIPAGETPGNNEKSFKYFNRGKTVSKNNIPIAVIGMSGIMPASENLTTFWENLVMGKDMVTQTPEGRFDMESSSESDEHQYLKKGGFIKGVDEFDPLFFGISPRDAELMDPQQRLVLESVWKTIEDAGYKVEDFSGTKTAIFIGVGSQDYGDLLRTYNVKFEAQASIGLAHSMLVNRISYFLNTNGPSEPVDTACSSSLVAIHRAVHLLQTGECEMAFAGGVNALLSPTLTISFAGAGMLSPDGICKTFDENADGYVRGEGCGIILLKPLPRAEQDGDTIYGIIKGTAVNHGGRANSLTAPNANAQANLLINAFKNAGIDPFSLTYIETHGTGTSLGDPVEIDGLKKAFCEWNKKHASPLASRASIGLGAVKTSIGHLETAAGIAGVLKVLLSIKHKCLPKNLHFKKQNPYISLKDTPFYFINETKEWKSLEDEKNIPLPRRAGISSFGFGGVNAHIVLEEYNDKRIAPETTPPYLFILSARNENALKTYAKKLLDYLEKINSTSIDKRNVLSSVVYTLQVGREAFSHRLAFPVSGISEASLKLKEYIEGKKDIERFFTGNTKDKTQQFVELIHDMEDQSYIQSIVKAGKLDKLAKLWVAGMSVNWKLLFPVGKQKRISLPGYPFIKKRYWFTRDKDKIVNESPTPAGIHPLIDANISTLIEQKYSKVLTGNEYYLEDHRIFNKRVLPGAVYIEMARKAGELALKKPVTRMTNIVWSKPLLVGNSEERLEIILHPKAQDVQFQITTVTNGSPLLLSQGKLGYDYQDTGDNPVNIDSLLGSFKNEMKGNLLYEQYRKNGLHYGEGFRVIDSIYYNEKEALARLVLPGKLKEEKNHYYINPSLLDAGFQATAGLFSDKNADGMPYLPFTIEEIIVLKPLTALCYSHVVLADNNSPHDDVKKFNIRIINENNEIALMVRGLTARAMSQSSDKNENKDNGVLYYKNEWIEAGKPVELQQDKGNTLAGPLLIFDDSEELYRQLIKNQKVGHNDTRVILVKPGETFSEERLEEQIQFIVNPENHHHYPELFQRLEKNNLIPRTIIYNWADRGGEDNDSMTGNYDSENMLDYSFYPLLYSVQSLIKVHSGERTAIYYLYSTMDGMARPEHAAVSSLLTCSGLEFSRLVSKVIEINKKGLPGQGSLEGEPGKLDIILMESTFDDERIIAVRYPGNKRFITYPVPFQFPHSAGNRLIFQDGGVYLITGGAGGLGMIFTHHISRQANAVIILLGRSVLSPGKMQTLKDMEENGSRIEYVVCDIKDRESLQTVIKDIKTKYKKINGVIHSAGVIRDSYLTNKTREEISEVFGPKITGTINLDYTLSDEKLDFFVLFSSISAIIGNPGQTDYAYANGFMDNFAIERENNRKLKKRFGKTISINWPFWEEGGMQIDENAKAMARRVLGVVPLSTQNGIYALTKGLESSITQFMVMEGNTEKIKSRLAFPPAHETASTENDNEGSEGSPDEKGIKRQLLHDIVKIVVDTLHVDEDEFDPDEEMNNYGFDSISLTQFANKIDEQFDFDLSPAVFFELPYPSINGFIDYLYEHFFQSIKQRYCPDKEEEKPGNATTGTSPTQADNTIVYDSRFINPAFVTTQSKELTAEKQAGSPVAIIGMSGIMPQSDNLGIFWNKLEQGENMVTQIPGDRFDMQNIPDADVDLSRVKWGAFIKNVDHFDPLFFGISPTEAKLMDPQQRLVLETVWKTIEDAGYNADVLSGTDTAVFIGVGNQDYGDLLRTYNIEVEAHSSIGLAHSMLANRISYFLNINGPSEPVDTACSSSLVAIHKAVQVIRSGECRMALAGGVNVLLSPTLSISFAKAGLLSPDGKCQTFDENANGYVRGEGVGMVLLKSLPQAERDGDHIYAVIKGTAVNHGGRANSLTAPNSHAQAALLLQAFKNAGIDPFTLSFIEAHGTGTSLGDPVEINGLKNAFQMWQEKNKSPFAADSRCAIGAVKTNIGHLETAAGIAGILKVVLALEHKRLPKNLHFNKQNPYIKLENSPFYFLDETKEWHTLPDENRQNIPRRAGVSSFGFGGVNAHVILEEYQKEKKDVTHNVPIIFILSAKDRDVLETYAKSMKIYIEENKKSIDLIDLAYTLQTGRKVMEEKLSFYAGSMDMVLKRLTGFIEKNNLEGIYSGNTKKMKINNTGRSTILTSPFDKEKLDRLAESWVAGAEIDWQLLYKDVTPARISLPVYPFKKERYWFIENNQAKIINRAASQPEQVKKQERSDTLTENILQRISSLIGIPVEKINHDAMWMELGFDSILIAKLIAELQNEMNIRLYPNELIENDTIGKFLKYMEKEFGDKAPGIQNDKKNSERTLDSKKSGPEKPLVFLISTPRAGSTLLRVMLMGNSNIFAPPELHLLQFDSLKERREIANQNTQNFMTIGYAEAIQQLTGVSSEEAINKMKELEEQDLSLKESYQYLQNLAGDRYLVDKSPSYAQNIKALENAEKVGNKPYYIFLIRHPIAVMESFVRNRMHKIYGVKDDPWEFAENLWFTMNSNIKSISAKIPQERQIIVIYEELVTEPEKIMRKICNILGIEFEKEMLSPYKGDRATSGLFGKSTSIGDPNFHSHSSIDKKLAQSWEKHLDKMKYLTSKTKELAESFGYHFEPETHTINLLPAQKSYLTDITHKPDFFIEQSISLSLKEPVDISSMEACIVKLFKKHPVLGQYYKKEKNGWQAYESTITKVPLIFENVNGLNKRESEKKVAGIFKTMRISIDISVPPLAAFCLVRTKQEGRYQLLIVIHHLIADGVTSGILLKELFEYYQDPGKPVTGTEKGYSEYCNIIYNLADNHLNEDLLFWEKHISKTKKKNLPVDFEKGPDIIQYEGQVRKQFPFTDFLVDPLLLKGEIFYYLAIGLYQLYAEWANIDQPVIIHRIHRRNLDLKRHFFNAAGWFAGDIPLAFTVKPKQAVPEQIMKFKNLFESIPKGGISYELLLEQGKLQPPGDASPVRLNYQPIRIYSPFITAIDSTLYQDPECERQYLLDFIARSRKKELEVIIRYSKNSYYKKTIEDLMDRWMKKTISITGQVLLTENK